MFFGSHIANNAIGSSTNPTIPNNLNVHLQSNSLLIAPDIQPNAPPVSNVTIIEGKVS